MTQSYIHTDRYIQTSTNSCKSGDIGVSPVDETNAIFLILILYCCYAGYCHWKKLGIGYSGPPSTFWQLSLYLCMNRKTKANEGNILKF